jgi:SAM-dependent methyltransferase
MNEGKAETLGVLQLLGSEGHHPDKGDQHHEALHVSNGSRPMFSLELVKQTGERPLKDSTPSALLALHDAGYREILSRLDGRPVVDIGCGVGDQTGRLIAPGRVVFGLDYDADTADVANRVGVKAVCGDGGRLPFASGSMGAVCSSHIIEHFVDPEPHVAEAARVLCDDGVLLVLTPNEPADFENPFHVHLFRPNTLRAMLEKHFGNVEILGLDGDERVHADFERRRRWGRWILRLDPFGLRRRLPHAMFVRLHSAGRRLLYPIMNRRQSATESFSEDNFRVDTGIDDRTLVLFAIARSPKRT